MLSCFFFCVLFFFLWEAGRGRKEAGIRGTASHLVSKQDHKIEKEQVLSWWQSSMGERRRGFGIVVPVQEWRHRQTTTTTTTKISSQGGQAFLCRNFMHAFLFFLPLLVFLSLLFSSSSRFFLEWKRCFEVITYPFQSTEWEKSRSQRASA